MFSDIFKKNDRTNFQLKPEYDRLFVFINGAHQHIHLQTPCGIPEQALHFWHCFWFQSIIFHIAFFFLKFTILSVKSDLGYFYHEALRNFTKNERTVTG